MEEKKHKLKNITKPSIRRVLSWKEIQKAKKQGARYKKQGTRKDGIKKYFKFIAKIQEIRNKKQVTIGKKQKAGNKIQYTLIKQISIQKIILKLKSFFQLVSKFKFANLQNIHPVKSDEVGAKQFNRARRKRIITFSFSSTLAAITIVMVIFQFIFPTSKTMGASFTFVQASWAGGATANTGVHPTNQTSWNQYSAKDATIAAAAGGVSLTQAGSFSVTDNGASYHGLTPISPAAINTGTTSSGIVISVDGKSVYVTNREDNTISMYSRNTSTGVLTALSPATISAGSYPGGIAISADGKSVYVSSSNNNRVYMFSRNTTTGVLTALSPSYIAAGTNPYGIAISADGTSVYVANMSSSNISMYSRNTSTGALTVMSPATINGTDSAYPLGITISPDGTSVYMANQTGGISMYSRNVATGVLTALSPRDTNSIWAKYIAISHDGASVYATGWGGIVSMYSRNTSTGALTDMSPATISAGGISPLGITVSSDDTSVYAVNSGDSSILMYSRNTSTGALTALPPVKINTGSSPQEVTISADGNSVYVTNTNDYTVSMYSRNSNNNPGFGAGALSSTAIYGSGTSATMGLSTTTVARTNRSENFTYSGRVMSWTAPHDVTSITINAKGAGGGAGCGGTNCDTINYYGAAGGSATGTLAVTPGETYYFSVGGAGANGAYNTVSAGGYGGGGTAGKSNASYIGGGGGGMTWFSAQNTFAQNSNLKLVAGGGGGSSSYSGGSGAGGGTTGASSTASGGVTAAGGGTQNAGGAGSVSDAGISYNGTAGSAGQGGNGNYAAGGGGGGYFGGGGGATGNNYALTAGAGGSGYLNPSLTAASTTQGGGAAQATNGSLTITYDSASSIFYYTGAVVPYVVPAGAGLIKIIEKGAGGGGSSSNGPGGAGGESTGTLAVTPGSNYYVSVGGTNGYGGGGSGTSSGGGMTWFSAQNTFAQNSNLILVAGGGGGGKDVLYGNGGVGGGTSGGSSTNSGGGTQSAGGSSGSSNGAAGVGGNGSSGGGGGGGYYGGGGAVNYGGGGGSGFVKNTLTNATTKRGSGAAAENNGSAIITPYGYNSSGTFTSGVIDTGAVSAFSTLSYSATLNGQTLTINARAGNTATPDGTWTAWTGTIASGGSIATLSGNRYIQYRANFSTTDTAVTPTLSSVTIPYTQYNTSGTLTSSVYNTTDPNNQLDQLSWTETVPTGTDVKFQMRTAPNSGSSPDWANGSGWCGPANCAATKGDTDYAASFYNTTPAGETVNNTNKTSNNDQWMQYKVWLVSDGASTPTLSNLTLTYTDVTPPAITFTDDILAGPVQSDALTVTIADANPSASTYKYLLSSDNNCSSKDYGSASSFTSGVQIANYNTEINNGKYICIKAADTANNVSYAASSQALNIDITKPLLSTLTLSDPTPTKNGTLTMTLDFNEAMDTGTNPTVTFGTTSPFNQHAVNTNPTWIDSNTFTAEVAIPDGGTLDSSNTIKVSGAKDIALNTMLDNTVNNFVIDTIEPSSVINTPVDGSSLFSIPTISGTASDDKALDNVQISIKDTTDGSHWWNGSSWDATSEYWLNATDTTNWTFNTAGVTWQVDSSYLINSRATDTAGNAETAHGNTFTFINTAPVIDNMSASQGSNGTVTVNYDASDVESSSTVVSLWYDSNATLAANITDSSSTSDIQTSDSSHFPASGSILIKYENGDNDRYEYISYTGKSDNNLTGITRHTENTLGYSHALGEQIWIKANTVSDNFGTVNNGTGYHITWDIKTDTSFYDSAMTMRVATNDLASSNNIGFADSSPFVFDSKNPANVSFTIDHTTNELTLTTPEEDTAYQMYVSNYSDFNDASPIDFSSPYTYTGMTTDPATVYLRIKDEYNNYTDYSAATPAKAQNLKFYDTSSPVSGTYQEFIVWDVIPAGQVGAGFHSYNIYQKTDDGEFALVNNIHDREFNYYLAGNLDPASEYTFKLTVEDINHNISDYSATVTDVPNGTGSSDSSPPTISTVAVSNIETTSAKVTWTTEELSDSSVGYSTEYTYLPERGLATYTNNHEINLTGLTPDTEYNIRVKSRDIRGNLGFVCYGGTDCSPGSNLPGAFHFKTADGPAISNVRIKESSNTQATISWETNSDSNSHVIYSKTVTNGELVNPLSEDIDEYVGGDYPYIHEVTLDNLEKSTPYYFYVESQGAGDLATLKNVTADPPFFTFLTGNDTTPPEISDPEAIISSNTQVAIHWTTDEPSDSKVEYKKEGEDYSDNTPGILSTYDKSHYVILSNLDPLTEYTFKVTSADINGNDSFIDNNTFITMNDPIYQHPALTEITDIEVPDGNLSDANAVVTFATDQPALCLAELTTAQGSYTNPVIIKEDGYDQEENYSKNHTLRFINLIFSTPYYFRITCHDNLKDNENEFAYITSEENTFTTKEKMYTETEAGALGDKTAPSISNVGTESITGESVTVTWDTDEKGSSFVKYGITTDYENMAGNSLVNSSSTNYITAHSVIVNNLTPSTKYYFKAISHDTSGNIGESTEDSFTTESNSSLSSINIVSTSLGEVTVSWSTSKKMTSIVEYGLTDTYGQSKTDSTMASDHETKISGLTIGSIYHFMVKGKDADNNIYSSSDYSFKPKSPPKVNGITVSEIAEHTAKISIATDIPADALITYFEKGNDTNAGSQGKPDFATKHDINLANLKSGTTYSYAVKVSDEQGNQTTSDPKEFTTDQDVTPPIIDSVHTDNALAQSDKVQTIISCKTNEPATASVFYKEGRNGEEKELKMTTNLTTSQVAVITSFKTGTVYNFKIVATDANGNSSTSETFSLLTPIQKANVIQVIVNNFQDIFGWMKR